MDTLTDKTSEKWKNCLYPKRKTTHRSRFSGYLGMNPLNIIYGLLGLAIVSAVSGYVWYCEDAKDFKDKAVALAEVARDNAIKQMVLDRNRKEKADAELKTLRAGNLSLDQQLRDERARVRALSRPAARAPSPDRACFRGPILDAAVTRLINDIYAEHERRDQDLSEFARQCQDAVSGLDTAKKWAKEVSSSP